MDEPFILHIGSNLYLLRDISNKFEPLGLLIDLSVYTPYIE